MNETFIVGVISDKTFGPVLKPLIINKTEDKGSYPIEAQLNELNYSRYEPYLDNHQKNIFKIAQEYSDKQLYKLFGSKKHRTPKEFLNAINQEDVEKRIRPYIEKRHAKLVEELRKADIEVYFKDKYKYINKDNKIKVLKEQAKTTLNINKQANETRYHLSINQGGQEIHLLDKSYRILSSDPCNMVIDYALYSFEDVDANKLKPFFRKEYIIVPKNFEKKWFETFALPNIKKFNVNPTGFDIETLATNKNPTLTLTYDLSYKPAFLLSFWYNSEHFYANKGQENKVILEAKGDSYKFFKIVRDIQWEQNIGDLLHKEGLYNYMNSFFTRAEFKNKNPEPEAILFDLIDWLKKHKTELEKKGFTIKQALNEKTYSLDEVQLQSKVEEQQDWFDIKASVKIGNYTFPFVTLKKYILQGIREMKLPSGEYALLPEEWFSKYADLFKFGKTENNKLKISKHHFSLLEQSLEQFHHQYLDRLKDLSEDFQKGEITIPNELTNILRTYQLKGYRWMYLLSKHRFGGCLADDMGLGKTLQTLTMLLDLKKSGNKTKPPAKEKVYQQQLSLFDNFITTEEKPTDEGTGPSASPTSLIVTPTSLIHNWQEEIKKFTPQLSFYKFTGINRTREPEELCKYDIILTSYGIVRNDYELLQQTYFDYIILDESQYIKNPSSKIYNAVNKLESKHKFVLTGTPIENSLSDLWAQLNFLNKGLLGSYSFFRNEFIHPIEKNKDQVQEAKLQAIIDPFILRRTKNQVAKELPQKMEQVIYCEMTEEQKSYYEKEKSKIRNTILENLDEVEAQVNMKILEGLSTLRQAANHPAMIDGEYQGESGKFEEITEYLQNLISEDHKVLVFSSYKKHLRILENYFQSQGWSYTMLTGETYNREKVINEFQNNEEKKLFLIQIKAGGFGLNLTAADYVLIIDPWWNPAVEEQAINRAHRIGQDKNVMVYRFISTNTVEEKILHLQNRKSKLADTFITPNEALKTLTREQIVELFS
ncbi:MAG: DEAD/DEAH box helicase [Bacteroidales bacterium]